VFVKLYRFTQVKDLAIIEHFHLNKKFEEKLYLNLEVDKYFSLCVLRKLDFEVANFDF